MMYFSKEWSNRLSVLRKGATVSGIGKIVRALAGSITLEDCELE